MGIHVLTIHGSGLGQRPSPVSALEGPGGTVQGMEVEKREHKVAVVKSCLS